MLPRIDEALCPGNRTHLGLGQIAEGQMEPRKLGLRQHIKDICLILCPVCRLLQQPASALRILYDPRIMPRRELCRSVFAGVCQQMPEFHRPVAVDAGIRRPPGFIGPDELLDHFFRECCGLVQNPEGQIHCKCCFCRVVDVFLCAAGMKAGQADVFVPVQPQRHAFAGISCLKHQVCGHGTVYAAAHCNQYTFLFCHGASGRYCLPLRHAGAGRQRFTY